MAQKWLKWLMPKLPDRKPKASHAPQSPQRNGTLRGQRRHPLESRKMPEMCYDHEIQLGLRFSMKFLM
ncbi:MAG: hypothetical protein WCQ21_36185, partial [Verrucomicrobiota bacterium]